MVHHRSCKYSPECDESLSTQFAHQENSKQTPDTQTENGDEDYSKMNVDVNDSVKVTPPPIYAIPDKLKSKKASGSSNNRIETDRSFCEHTEKSCVQDLQNEVVYTACMRIHVHTSTTFPCLPRTDSTIVHN